MQVQIDFATNKLKESLEIQQQLAKKKKAGKKRKNNSIEDQEEAFVLIENQKVESYADQVNQIQKLEFLVAKAKESLIKERKIHQQLFSNLAVYLDENQVKESELEKYIQNISLKNFLNDSEVPQNDYFQNFLRSFSQVKENALHQSVKQNNINKIQNHN